jgi:hypothetical protein
MGGAGLVVLVVLVVVFISLRGPTGNTVTKDHFARLKSGMTESQVRSILGTPTAVEDSAATNRALGTRVPPELARLQLKQLIWKHGDDYIIVPFMGGSSGLPSGFIDGQFLVGDK